MKRLHRRQIWTMVLTVLVILFFGGWIGSYFHWRGPVESSGGRFYHRDLVLPPHFPPQMAPCYEPLIRIDCRLNGYFVHLHYWKGPASLRTQVYDGR